MSDSPGSLAILVHEQAPYRVHTIERFAAAFPSLQIHAFRTCATGGFGWSAPQSSRVIWHDAHGGQAITEQGRFAGYLREWKKGRRLIGSLEEVRPKWVIVCGYADLAHRRVIRYFGNRKIPVLLWADSNIRSEHSRQRPWRRRAKSLLLPALLRQCSAVLPWGSLGREYFLKYGVPDDRIFIVPPEPDYASIEHTPPEAIAAAAARFSLRPERRRFLYVGRLAAEKRVDLLIQAFQGLAPGRPDWDLLIVGDGPLKKDLQALVTPEHSSRITFPGAMTTPQALAPFYHLADVFVLPSDHEPWGMVVNEAAAAGLPLVCSDIVGAAADLLQDRINGRTFAHGDAGSLSTALAEMSADSHLPEMGNASIAALSDYRKKYDCVLSLCRALRYAMSPEGTAKLPPDQSVAP